jgi:dihydroorotase-like cyclic amidohydrolase
MTSLICSPGSTMAELDLIVRGGTLVTATSQRRADVGLADGKIAAIEETLPDSGLRLQGKVVCTLARGNVIWHDGRIVAQPRGRLIKPLRQ